MALSQLRRSYPEFRQRNTELLEIGPSLPANAARAFRQYLGGRLPEFPYLCDPDFTVHKQYGLRRLGPTENVKTEARSALTQLTEHPFVTPNPREVGKLVAQPMEQGLFIVDESGLVRYVHVTTPSGKLSTPTMLFDVLDHLGDNQRPVCGTD